MTRLTVLEIYGNYPDNILIESVKDKGSEKWTSLMYMTRNGSIHKLMLSFDNFPFASKKEATEAMEDVAKKAIEYANPEV